MHGFINYAPGNNLSHALHEPMTREIKQHNEATK